MIQLLSIEDLLYVAEAAAGTPPLVQDPGLLASAAMRPQQSVCGQEAYPTFEEKAAALLHSIVCNHALVDGNSRTGWVAVRLFYSINDRQLSYGVDEAEKMILDAAQGNIDFTQIASWLSDHETQVDTSGEGQRSAPPTPPGTARQDVGGSE